MIKRILYAALLAGGVLAGYCAGSVSSREVLERSAIAVEDIQRQNGLGIVVVDMQEEFVGEKNLHASQDHLLAQFRKEVEEELEYQVEVLEAAKEKELPVFVLEYEGYGKTIPRINRTLQGYQKAHFLAKRTQNGFRATNLERELQQEGVQQVVLMGIYGKQCVMQTAIGARAVGLEVIASPQLIEDHPTDKGGASEGNLAQAWYRRNTIYAEDYVDILEAIEGR